MRLRPLVSRHRSSVGPRWPSKRSAALHRWPIRSVWAARCALRCAPRAARSLRHLIRDATLVSRHRSSVGPRWPSKRIAALHRLPIQLGMGCAMRLALRSDGCAQPTTSDDP
ncbi:hypothetical protein [Verminephrobacter eiseniae]|uniref:hypothetical protein n=1 Tax=Verminephrobacter eiseniae TaxID=364317 RepID=UPI0022448086|nr:hypothetical protein [Verminephrobacter eiseniae]